MLKILPDKNNNNAEVLGKALRSRRKEIGLTMQQVADAAGLSVGFISQVERGLTAPSLGSLASLAGVLDTPIGNFLDQPASGVATTRGINRHAYSVAGADVSYERLSTSFTNSQLHSVIVHEPPGHRSEPISHQVASILWCGTMDIFGDAPLPIHTSSTKNTGNTKDTGNTSLGFTTT